MNHAALDWIAIGLSLSAVLVLVRYASRPRCPLCARRHDRRVVMVVRDPARATPAVGEHGPRRGSGQPAFTLPTPDVASFN